MSTIDRPGIPEGLRDQTMAGVLRRSAAFLIDLAILAPMVVAVTWVWVRLFAIDLPPSRLPWYGLLVLAGIFGLYFLVGHLLLQGSAGMRLLGLALVDEQGLPPGVAVSVARVLTALLSAAYFLLGHLWMLFDGSRQGYHDQVAQTWVIRRRWRYLTLPAPSDTQNRGL
jgi:uncharacterized RDD family membrane protein YckC